VALTTTSARVREARRTYLESIGYPAAVNDRAPVVDELVPDSATAGSHDLVLTVHGRRFAPDAVVTFDGEPLRSWRTSAYRLHAVLPIPAHAIEQRVVEVRATQVIDGDELLSDPWPFTLRSR
jgi:hypothetical protein